MVQAQSRGKGAVGGGDGGGVLEEQVQSRYRAGTEQVQRCRQDAEQVQRRCRGAEWVHRC